MTVRCRLDEAPGHYSSLTHTQQMGRLLSDIYGIGVDQRSTWFSGHVIQATRAAPMYVEVGGRTWTLHYEPPPPATQDTGPGRQSDAGGAGLVEVWRPLDDPEGTELSAEEMAHRMEEGGGQ